MNLLSTLNENVNLNRLKGAGYDTVKNAFFANYLTALVMLKIQDLKGLMIINDKANSKLTKFSSNMSDLNFWGRALFYPEDPQVKNRLKPGHADILYIESGRVMDSRIHWLMAIPMTAPNLIQWDQVIASMLLLKHRYELKSSYFNKILSTLYRWDTISLSARRKIVNDCFMYLLQSDPQSSLLARTRELSSGTMLSRVIGDLAMKFVGFKKLQEDDGAGSTGAGNVGSSQNAIIGGGNSDPISLSSGTSSSQDQLGNLYSLIKQSSSQVTRKGKILFKGNKVIKKKVKKFKSLKFKAPEFMKLSKTGETNA